MKLTLLRHAQTEGSLRNLYYGCTDVGTIWLFTIIWR